MSDSRIAAFRWPEEHGAWGILAVPFVCAATVAGNWAAPLLLCALCALSLFILNGALETGFRGASASRQITAAHVALLSLAAASGGMLVFVYRRYELLVVGAAAAILYLLRRWLLAGHEACSMEKRSLWAELVGAALLTLSAPAAWIAARGSLVTRPRAIAQAMPAGVLIWLLSLLFFLAGILCVKYRVRGLLVHREFQGIGERLAFAWPVFVYHFLLAIFLAAWILREWLSPAEPAAGLQAVLLGLAFVPGLLRAARLFFQLGRRFRIRRLGWSEVLHSAVFAALLILALRITW